tara:strand:+ start:1039 stop:1509 length:471 start_codon:yes stop_codon:yes gene_type:complete
MTAFDRAWGLVKAPFHGTSDYHWDKIVESGGMRPNTFAAGYKGESQIPESVTTTEEEAMEDAWEYALGNVIGSEGGTPLLFYINPDHPDVYLDSDDRDFHLGFYGKLGDVGHVISQADIPLEAIEPVFEGDSYDIDFDDEDEWHQRQLDLLREVLY